MAKFRLEINCDNAAFAGDYNAVSEIQRILTILKMDVDADMVAHNDRIQLRDTNGNVVGHAEYTDGE